MIRTLGKFINCKSVIPSEAETTMNNQGMSGLNSSIHLHSTKIEDAYMTENRPVLVYEFERIYRLGYLYIWNLNAEGMLDCGLREVVIEYSVDGVRYTALTEKPIVLARALEEENERYRGNCANNQDDGNRTPVDFGGVCAKFVRIKALSNYGGKQYGLSEVRFFAYKTRPNKGEEIYAFSMVPNAPDYSENLSNGVNRCGDLITDKADLAWSVEVGEDIKENFILIDLDGSYPVDRLRLYNHNVSGQYNNGVERFTLQYSVKRPNRMKKKSDGYEISYEDCDWIDFGEVRTIPASDCNHCGEIEVDLQGIRAQYLKIIPESNYGGKRVGLSAIQVFAASGIAVAPEYEWSGLLSNEGSFPYQQSMESGGSDEGWLFADGIYTVNLNGSEKPGSADQETRTMFIFSDTFYGNFANYSSGKYGTYGNTMNICEGVNHSMAYLIGNKPDPRKLSFWLHNGASKGNIINARDWLTDLVCIDQQVYFYGMRFNDIWMPDSMDMVRINLDEKKMPHLSDYPEMRGEAKVMYQDDTYFYLLGPGVFDNTHAAMATPSPDGYIYWYGYRSTKGSKKPIVGRTRPENIELEELWEFYDGSEWVKGIENCGIIGDVEVSSEYSVHYVSSGKYAGKYVLCFTELCESGNIMISVADELTGPFDYNKTETIYHCNEKVDVFATTGDDDVYAYNAKCHPHLSAEGEMLISYNVNTHNFDKNKIALEYIFPHFVVLYEIH